MCQSQPRSQGPSSSRPPTSLARGGRKMRDPGNEVGDVYTSRSGGPLAPFLRSRSQGLSSEQHFHLNEAVYDDIEERCAR